MSLLYNNPEANPQTHVLIIGVGGYPYLSGGDREITQSVDAAKQLGQLSSPPVSAEAFYNTVMKLHEDGAWIKPVGSVEVLISPCKDGKVVFEGQQPDIASMSNIDKAYWDWKARCDRHPDNVAIFYFSGHGLEKAEHYLLAEDFGANPGNPWRGGFAFDMTRRAFSTCKASAQLFFIDACRQVTSDMLTTDLSMSPIENPNILAKDCLYHLTQKATAVNESAYGKKNEVSFYTKALIGALCGDAVTQDSETNKWCIDTGTLASKMTSFIKKIAPDQGYEQRCVNITSDVTNIIQFMETPNTELTITCLPEAALEIAKFSYLNLASEENDSRSPKNEPWEVKVKAGIYKVEASFINGQYDYGHAYKNCMPPSALHTFILM